MLQSSCTFSCISYFQISEKSCLTFFNFNHRLAHLHPPTPEVEEVEKIALARLPSLAEEEVVLEQKEMKTKKEKDMEENGDGDSAIHLDCVQEGVGGQFFDSSDDFPSPNSSPRRLQRSVSDVVGCQMLVRSRRRNPEDECFPSPLYRGFLLRHQRRQRESREVDGKSKDADSPDHLGATETYNVMNNYPKIRHLEDRNCSSARNCSNLEHFESKLRKCHQALSLSIPVVREDDTGGGRAKKKTTIIIGNP